MLAISGELTKQFQPLFSRKLLSLFKGVKWAEMIILSILENLHSKLIPYRVNVSHPRSALARADEVPCVLGISGKPQMLHIAATSVTMKLMIEEHPVWDRANLLLPHKSVGDGKSRAGAHNAITGVVRGSCPDKAVLALLHALHQSRVIKLLCTISRSHVTLFQRISHVVRPWSRVPALAGADSIIPERADNGLF